MPLSSQKPSLSTQGLSSTYGSPVASRTFSSAKKRPEWNDRPVDDEQYKLSKEEMLKKKKMYVSKHNVLASGSMSQPRSVRKRKSSGGPRSTDAIMRQHDKTGFVRDPLLEMTSLDYLDSDQSVSDDAHSDADSEVHSDDGVGRQDGSNLDETTNLTSFVTVKKKTHARSLKTSQFDSPATLHTPSGKRQTPVKAAARSAASKPMKNDRSSVSSRLMKESSTPVSTDILEMLRALYGELTYYEELSGRRSVFDFSELNCILDTYTEVEEDGLHLPRKHVSLEGVVRYLIQLVCQSMTYLLQSEVKLSQQQTDYESLSKRVEVLTSLVTAGRGLANNSMRVTPPLNTTTELMPESSKEESKSAFTQPSVPAPSLEKFTTPTRRDFSGFDSASSQFSQKMGTAASDWLFASPIPRVTFSDQKMSDYATDAAANKQAKVIKSALRDSNAVVETPPEPSSTQYTSIDADKTFDLFGREKRNKRIEDSSPNSMSTPPFIKSINFQLKNAESSEWTPRVSGRSVHGEEKTSSSYDKSAESNYYFDMLHKNDEDETDKMYQENLNSVARKLYAESLERSNMEDSESAYSRDTERVNQRNGVETPSLPPRSPAPVSRVEKLQKSLLANKYAAPSNRTFLTDVQSSLENDTMSHNTSRWSKGVVEQISFGSIPPPPPPAPHTAPVHPYYNSSRVAGDMSRGHTARQVYDATCGSY